jgi:hypothetical protein
MLGIPVELEKRTQTGVEGLLKCGAVESFFASSEGVKVPTAVIPLAWAIMSLLVRVFHSEQKQLTWSEAWMRAKDVLQLSYQSLRSLHNLVIGWERHIGNV